MGKNREHSPALTRLLRREEPGTKAGPVRPRRRVTRFQAVSTAVPPAEPLEWPMRWFYFLIGLVLVPLVIMSSVVFFSSLSAVTSASALVKSPPLIYFGWGVLIWTAAFMAGLQPRFLYVLGHELTHAAFAKVCGGYVVEFQAGANGGYVMTDKNNPLVALSPYFVPFWTLVWISLCAIGWLVIGHRSSVIALSWPWLIDIPWSGLIFFGVGYTWGFHFTFTLWMISRDQPDLKQQGVFFSLLLIYLVNLLLIAALVVGVSPELQWSDLADTWSSYSLQIWQNVKQVIKN
jgi:hypothetical protein